MGQKRYWHFLPKDKRLFNGDNRKVVAGRTLAVSGRIIACKNGLHASRWAVDALKHAPGPIICRVTLGGDMAADDYKVAARERTVLWMANASRALRMFALQTAEQAAEAANLHTDGIARTLEQLRRCIKAPTPAKLHQLFTLRTRCYPVYEIGNVSSAWYAVYHAAYYDDPVLAAQKAASFARHFIDANQQARQLERLLMALKPKARA